MSVANARCHVVSRIAVVAVQYDMIYEQLASSLRKSSKLSLAL